jgi:hypothetical protein
MTNVGEHENKIGNETHFTENTIKETTLPAPQCMIDRFNNTEVDPICVPLTKSEFKEAKQELLKDSFSKFKFPRIYKSRVDPQINGQQYSLHSFIPAKGATPDKDGVFGIFKNRGNFNTLNEANEHSELLIRSIDSVNEIFIGFCGKEFPLTMNSNWCSETKEIDVKNKLDEVAKAKYKEQREKEQKDMDEIQERQKKLLSDNKEMKQESKDDLDYYIMLRVKYANLKLSLEELKSKVKNVDELLEKSKVEIKEMTEKHPEHKEQYMAKYKNALDSSGISTESNPLIKYMNDLDDTPYSGGELKFPVCVEVKPVEEENKDGLFLADRSRLIPIPEQDEKQCDKVDCIKDECKC